VEAATDSNVFTDADHTKLNSIDQGVATTDSPTFAAATVTGEITANGGIALGDGDELTLGDSDEFKIKHHASGYTHLQNTVGTLYIDSDSVTFRDDDGSPSNMVISQTGIDVTGSVTADGAVNSTYFTGGSSSIAGRQLTLSCEDGTGGQDNATHRLTVPSGYGSFATSVGGSERMRISSDGTLTSTVAGGVFETRSDGGGFHYKQLLDVATAGCSITGQSNRGDLASIRLYQTATGADGGYIRFDTSPTGSTTPTERMRIDSSGRAGIGVSSPSTRLEVGGGGGTEAIKVSAGAGWADLRLHSDATNGGSIYFNDGADAGQLFYYHVDDTMRFHTATAERMRIDASGNLLVGKTAEGTATDGIELNKNDVIVATRNGDAPLILNRRTSNGDIVLFRKDNVTVGSIGTESGNLFLNSVSTGLLSTAGTARYKWDVDQFYPNGDNAKNLGTIANRFDDIYATNGTIQTSDFNEKQDIAELNTAETAVAVACKGLLRKFRWKDAVAEKGDDARTHFGIIAQDLQSAFAAEGLDAGDYAMFISSTWTDEETNEEKTRMGVRYSELLAFIIAAI
jgi:hypothetical protein